MGKNNALLISIMNDVSGYLDTVQAPVSVASEMDAFIALDPLLASLHKRYLDAKQFRIRAQAEYGADDGMADMAVIAEDSAWCAMQTRYMEVRKDRAMMAQAQKLMAEALVEEAAERKREKEKEALKLLELMEFYVRLRENAQKNSAYIWLVYLLLCSHRNVTYYTPNYVAQNFNRLAA